MSHKIPFSGAGWLPQVEAGVAQNSIRSMLCSHVTISVLAILNDSFFT